jgi:hypothetical protein
LHVRPDSPAPTLPFASWTTAALTIQDAIDAAQPGDTVLVTNGIYATGGPLSNRVVIDKAIRVQSVNGAALTTIVGAAGPGGSNGAGAMRCVYVGPDAVLAGFTLTNGHTLTPAEAQNSNLNLYGGGAFCESSGAISNCVFTGNFAHRDGGGVSGGRIFGSTFTNNVAFDDGGGADRSEMFNCIIARNRSALSMATEMASRRTTWGPSSLFLCKFFPPDAPAAS